MSLGSDLRLQTLTVAPSAPFDRETLGDNLGPYELGVAQRSLQSRPCTGCYFFNLCAREHYACEAFYQWVSDGKHSAERIPTSEWFRLVFSGKMANWRATRKARRSVNQRWDGDNRH